MTPHQRAMKLEEMQIMREVEEEKLKIRKEREEAEQKRQAERRDAERKKRERERQKKEQERAAADLADAADAGVGPPPGGALGGSGKFQGVMVPSGATKLKDVCSTDELGPSADPKRELQSAMQQMKSQEWDQNFDALDSVRRLAAFHPDLLLPQLHAVLVAVLQHVENLRSGVMKNAIVCYGDLFKALARHLEPELEIFVPKLMGRYAETSTFLVKELDRTLGLMIELTPHTNRVLTVLLPLAKHKHASIRGKCAYLIANALEKMETSDCGAVSLDKLVPLVSGLLSEANGDTRANGRRAAFALQALVQRSGGSVSALVQRALNESQAKAMLELLEKTPRPARCEPFVDRAMATVSFAGANIAPSANLSSTIPAFPSASAEPAKRALAVGKRENLNATVPPSNKPKPTAAEPAPDLQLNVTSYAPAAASPSPAGNQAKRPAAKAAAPKKEPQEFENLPNLWRAFEASDWNVRLDAIGKLMTLVNTYPTEIRGRAMQIVDHMAIRANDSNSKVNVFALETLANIIPVLQDSLTPGIGVLFPALAISMASSVPAVVKAASTALDTLLSTVDCTTLLQPFKDVIQNGNRKIQVPMIEKLVNVIPDVSSKQPKLVLKYCLPIALGLADEKKAELKTVNSKLMAAMHSALGNSLLEHVGALNEANRNKLYRLLNFS
eukprot:TRINITY_DN3064_c1_g1_i1.p1 TRINITY_DN3064_c1_g1~~TRINITY_DN3064_c1_g1_i1.p1  ORF type:complete len:672 (-),score=296.70 TRINITY_DN3064_c1_g1_i1:282-2297(-)